MYKIVAFVGEAGCGKDTLANAIAQLNNNFKSIISCTTRPPREGEENGKNYYFISEAEFNDKILNEEMLEYTEFNDWYYGTSVDSLDKNKINVGVFNPEGIRNLLKNDNVDVIIFRLAVSAKTRLLRQLNRELKPDVDEIVRRYFADSIDFCDLGFDYIELENECLPDKERALKIVKQTLSPWLPQGQKWLIDSEQTTYIVYHHYDTLYLVWR